MITRVFKKALLIASSRFRAPRPVSDSIIETLAGSEVILVAGMSRSASTWLYNATRLVLCSSDERANDFSCGWVDDLQKIPKKRCMLIKLHAYDQGLVDSASTILYSYRDIRDSLASSQRKYGHTPTMQRADSFAEQYEKWVGVTDFTMRYESMLINKKGFVEQVAETLGVESLDSTAIVEEIEQLDYQIEGPRNERYHEVNLLHQGHLTDGRHGAWKTGGNEELFARIEQKHQDWFNACGYSVKIAG